MNIKQISLLLSSTAALVGGASAQNLIINGDFETGLSGGGSGSYANEIGTFSEEPIDGTDPIVNNSNWVITTTYLSAEFRHLLTPASTGSWAARMGGYTDSYLRNTDTISLAAGEYIFSADHWGEPANSTGTIFTASLYNTDTTLIESIGTFTDTVSGSAQTHTFNLTLNTSGNYQLQLSGSNATAGPARAWVDNISLTAVPEPSSAALLIGLSGLGLALYRRRKAASR